MDNDGKLVKLEVDGYRYYYRLYKNPSSHLTPVFIFNGFLQNMNSWIKYIKYFISDSSVIIADLPGAGKADSISEGEFDLERMGYYVYRILEKVEIEQIDIISASYGASIAYGFAKNYPDNVKSIMAAGTMSSLNEELRQQIEQSVKYVRLNKMNLFADVIIKMLLNEEKKNSINKFYVVKKLLYNQFKNLSDHDKEKYVINCRHLLNHPVLDVSLSKDIKKLIVTGEHDKFTKPENGKELAARLSNCIFTTLKNADHLFHLEQTSVTLNMIKKFFRDEQLESVPGINTIEYY